MSPANGHYARQQGFSEAGARQLFQAATNVRTLAIYCLDPRASGIPAAIAREFGEVWPGEIVQGEAGEKAAFTANIGTLSNAGGRAVDALRSLTALHYLLDYQKIAVVHHTFCGMTAFTADAVIEAYRHDHGADIAGVYNHRDLQITDLEQSVREDVALVRSAPAVPGTLDLYGFIYDIDTETLIRVVEDRGRESA